MAQEDIDPTPGDPLEGGGDGTDGRGQLGLRGGSSSKAEGWFSVFFSFGSGFVIFIEQKYLLFLVLFSWVNNSN